ncbi:hypothetical protein ACFP1Z_03755 [Streptomyces gamaensis]|uniref:Uncharacterized protein n=1 Tax=Streptomyces gamaensis TaxID=1763542 RepID=A0ABW0YRY9_9ACTN
MAGGTMTRTRKGKPGCKQAWRYAHGMTQDEAAERCNSLTRDGEYLLTGKRISEYGLWPPSRSQPGVQLLRRLGHAYETSPNEPTDLLDRMHLPR